MPADAYEYFHYYLDITKADYSDLGVRIEYNPDWGMEIAARPSDGGILRTATGQGDKDFLRALCFQFYHFTYDVNYPVLITIRDDDSFSGRGYRMRFALPVQIIHNAPDRADRGTNLFETGGTTYCDSDGPLADIRVKGSEDGFSGIDLDGVDLTYDCLKYQCPIGTTQADGGIFRLRTKLPSGPHRRERGLPDTAHADDVSAAEYCAQETQDHGCSRAEAQDR